MLLGQRGDRLQEAQHQRDRQREIDQNAQNPAAAHQPFAARPGKENKRQKAIEQNDDEYKAERGLKNLVDPPAPLFEHREAHQQGDRSRHDLGQHRHGERGAGAADSQLGLNSLLERSNVFLELARKEPPDLGIYAVGVRDERQQAEKQQQRSCNGIVHRVRTARVARAPPPADFDFGLGFVLLTRTFLSIKPGGSPSDCRKAASRRAIAPSSCS